MRLPFKRLVVAVILVLFPFLILYANTRNPAERGFISRSIIYVQYPAFTE